MTWPGGQLLNLIYGGLGVGGQGVGGWRGREEKVVEGSVSKQVNVSFVLYL